MSEQNMLEWYEKLYIDIASSKTYSLYCSKVFGIDFSQQGFSNLGQLNLMLSKLDIKPKQKVLNIACGLGKFDEYIHNKYEAEVIGVDYSPNAIKLSKKREKAGLSFKYVDMDDIDYPDNSFDAIICIDAIFFSKDLVKLIDKLSKMLIKGGKLAIAYIEIIFDEDTDKKILLAENTMVGKAFTELNLEYEVFDVTDNTYEHMMLKHQTAIEMKDLFINESNDYLYEYIFRESIPPSMTIEQYKEQFARYLYIYRRCL